MRFAAAIAALILLGGGYFITTLKQSNEALYRRNFTAYQPPSVARSAETRYTDFQRAMDLYKKSNFAAAASCLKNYLKSNPEESEAMMVYGISEMQVNNFPEAKTSFRSLLGNADNLYIDVAQWYLALCYVKTNEKNEAVRQLEAIIPSNSIYREDARKLLKKLR
jgi:tetratricopeptide (TPR) repeat protein